MRNDAYVEKLFTNANDPKADAAKVARMIESFHRKLEATPTGRKALEAVSNELARKATKRAFKALQ